MTENTEQTQQNWNFLLSLAHAARGRNAEPDTAMRGLVRDLRQKPVVLDHVRQTLRTSLSAYSYVHAIAESGILTDHGASLELMRRLSWKLLPELLDDDDIRTVIDDIFEHHGEWLEGVSVSAWQEFVDLMVNDSDVREVLHVDFGAALRGLAQRIGALGIDEEFVEMLGDVEAYNSPFLDLTAHAHVFLASVDQPDEAWDAYQRLIDCIQACRTITREFREQKPRYGTSLRMTIVSRRLLQQLERLELVAQVMRPSSRADLVASLAHMTSTLLRAHRRHRSVRTWLHESSDLIAFQLTELSAKKGNKYISTDRAGYISFFWAAFRGGGIVAVFAVFKLLIDAANLPLAVEAVAFSLNYALCFTLIYLSGSILATKQPAVTASAIAQKMDATQNGDAQLAGVVETVMLVWRSQFISFVGNLLCAFPMAWLIAAGAQAWLDKPVAGPSKAQYLLDAVHPWASGALYYAAIAGVFLFLSGFLAVAVNNAVIHSRASARLQIAPVLRRFKGLAASAGEFANHHLGVVTGNIILGFMLGTAGMVGVIFGLPFDIRHIAFSSAHFGVAAFAAPNLITFDVAFFSTLGVMGIGFVNFLVSFGLTMLTALRSRRMNIHRGRLLAFMLFNDFRQRPAAWFFPVEGSSVASTATSA